MYNNYNYKKAVIKNILIIVLILLIAAFSTYSIYNHFLDNGSLEYTSDSLSINFYEENGENLDILKITPLNDSVGISSNGHIFTIKNNLNVPVDYQIKIEDNIQKIIEDDCKKSSIPHENIRISIKKPGIGNEIYTLSELKNNILLEETLNPLEEIKYNVRVWVSNDNIIQSGSNYHYHGKIVVKELTGEEN